MCLQSLTCADWLTSPVAAAATMVDGHRSSDEIIVGVSVPATSANLGPGYDSLGVALDVPLVAVAGRRRPARVTTAGFGADELPDGDDNLVWRAVLSWCSHVDAAPPDVSIHVRSAIPLERGMGSSSAAVVAGLLLGRALVGGAGGTAEVLALATDLEGHPDNAAAALVGGLVLCLPDGTIRRVPPTEGLRPVLLIPTTRQNTSQARTVLASSVPLDVAAGNAARAMATFAGLSGITRLEVGDMVDDLHEPPRLAIMPTASAVIAGLRAASIPAALSGAGPAVLAVVRAHDSRQIDVVNRVVGQAARDAGADVEVLVTRWDLSGAELCPPPVS